MTTPTRTAGRTRRWACLAGCLVLLWSQPSAPASADPADAKRAEARRIAAETAAAERDLARAEAEAAGVRSRLAAEAVDTYVKGGIELGSAPAAAGDGDPLRRRQYVMTLQAKRADALDAAKAQAAVVREKKERLEQARRQAQGAVADVERAQRQAQEASARLEAVQSRVDAELAVLVQQEQDERAAAEAAEVQARLAARNPASAVAALPPPTRPSIAVVAAPVATPAPSPGAPSAPSTTRPPPKPPVAAPDAGNEAPAPNPGAAAAVAEARRQIGKPYQWGGSGPDSFDCSGLTAWAWKAGGRILPHSSRMQYASLPKVNPADARPGDLFAFGSPIHHIGIYIGGGQMIAAPQTGKNVQYQPAYRRDLTGVVRP